jgi:hypothetical protein
MKKIQEVILAPFSEKLEQKMGNSKKNL